jgi:large subunit ribosomal protein L6e
MAELLFIAPIERRDPTRPTWRGIPRISLARPIAAREVDPIAPLAIPEKPKPTRTSLSVGTIVIILEGQYKAKRAVVVSDHGAGVVGVAGTVVPYTEIDQDFLIATATKVELGNVDAGNAAAAVEAAAGKVAGLKDFLGAPFSLKPGERPHLMKF